MAMPPVQVWESLLQYHVYYIVWGHLITCKNMESPRIVFFLFFFGPHYIILPAELQILHLRLAIDLLLLWNRCSHLLQAICCTPHLLLEAREARETIEILGGSKSTPSHVKKSCQTSKNSRAVPISSCSLWEFMFMVPQRNEELQKKWANIN